MAILHLQIDVRVTPRVFRWGLTALLLAAASTELASESVTLTTYYPAPSGVYSQMITTGNTFLARDVGGNVVVGGTAAAAAKLHIQNNGALMFGSSLLQAGVGGTDSIELGGTNATAGIGNPYIDFHRGGLTQDFNARIINDANGVLSVMAAGGLRVNNVIISRTPLGDCDRRTFSYRSVTNCGLGRYSTLASGIMVKRWELGVITNPNTASFGNSGDDGSFFCCLCPSGGCPSL